MPDKEVEQFLELCRQLFNHGTHGDAIKALETEDPVVYEEFLQWFQDDADAS